MIGRLPAPLDRYDRENERQARVILRSAVEALQPTTGTYTPVVTSSGGGETLTYTTQLGQWVRVGSLLWFIVELTLATKAGGSGDIQISLPATAGAQAPLACAIDNMGATWTGAPMAQITGAGVRVVRLRELAAGASAAAWAKLGATGGIRLAGFYQPA